jgi:hypothetical protein
LLIRPSARWIVAGVATLGVLSIVVVSLWTQLGLI